VLIGQRRPCEPAGSPFTRSVARSLPVSVEIDNETSDTLTIIDITARDRVGLLYRVTKALYDLNLDIASAKIVTEGAKVTDAFYVSDLFRSKIQDPERIARIKETLLAVLR
jgi:[protein-PII] uridylyltransferase